MTVDMESRLAQALRARAVEVEPDARTWELVQSRLRRSRQRRMVLAGAAAVAVVALAAVAVPALLGPGVIQFEPPVADQPGEEDASTGEDTGVVEDPGPGEDAQPEGGAVAVPDLEPCQESVTTAAVISRDGNLWTACANGLVVPLAEGEATDRRPAVSPDGAALVFERTEPGGEFPLLVHRALAGDASDTIRGGGMLPAFAPDGRLAWVQDAGDGTSVIQFGEVFAEPEGEAGVPSPAEDIRSLQWDAGGERLLYTVGGAGGIAVWTYEPAAGHFQVVLSPEAGYVAAAFGPDGTLAALHASGDLDVLDPQVLSGGELLVERTITSGIAPVDAESQPFLAPAGLVRVDVASSSLLAWSHAEEPSWFVGDGAWLYLAEASGATTAVTEGVDGVAVNPAVELGTAAHAGTETGGPEASGEARSEVEARQRELEAVERARAAAEEAAQTALVRGRARTLQEAAARRDTATLRAMMAPDFTYSFGAAADRDDALAHFEADPGLLDQLVDLLGTPHGVIEGAGPALYVWPRAHGLDPTEWTGSELATLRSLGATEAEIEAWQAGEGYTGLRAGMTADGRWRFLVAGD